MGYVVDFYCGFGRVVVLDSTSKNLYLDPEVREPNRKGKDRLRSIIFQGLYIYIYTLRIQVYPKEGISPIILF